MNRVVEAFYNKVILRINSLFSRAEVTLIDDSKKFQSVQVKINEDEILSFERLQDYGFSSNPQVASEAMVVFQGGKRSNGLILKVDDRRFRIKGLQSGEVAIYTDEGDKIHFKRERKIDVVTNELTINATAKVVINTAEAEVNANKTTVTSPEVNINSTTKVSMNTPALEVSGFVSCAGLAAGAGATPSEGKVSVVGTIDATGDIESQGHVKDSVGTMAQIRSIYNTHTHKVGASTSTTPEGTM